MIEAANHVVFPLVSWLITYLLHSTLIIAAALLVVRFFFKRSAGTRRQMLVLAMLLPLVTAAFSSLMDEPRVKYHTTGPGSTAAAVPITAATPWDWVTAGEIDLSVPVRLQGNDERTVVLNRSDLNRFLLCLALTAGWLAGAVLLARRFVSRWKSFRVRLASRREIEDGALVQVVNDLRHRVGISRRILITKSSGIDQITAMGFSEICLPAGSMHGLERGEVENIMAHELTHLKNLDPLLMVAASVINVLFFFQPLNLVAARRLQEESEYLADEGALALTRDPDMLASSLLKLARAGRARLMSSLAPGFSGRRPLLADRTRKILGWRRGKRPRWYSLPIMAAAAVAFVLATSVCLEGAVSIGRFWDGSSFRPPNLLADRSWIESRELKLVLPGGDRLHFTMERVFIDTRSAEVCSATHSDSSLTLERTAEEGTLRIEIRGSDSGPARKSFSCSGRPQPFDASAVSLLREALLVMIDND